ncbi:MAG: hypothetical protein NTV34_11815, partial [Proteobacteria bacterium]|nr:hypothetical protein [Pseudomonadota bacterium]
MAYLKREQQANFGAKPAPERTLSRDIAIQLSLWTVLAIIVISTALFLYELLRERSNLRTQTFKTANQVSKVQRRAAAAGPPPPAAREEGGPGEKKKSAG